MKQVNVYQEILQWSNPRPMWQRDALRRIVVNGSLADHDLTELGYLCCSPHDANEEVLSTVTAGEAGPVKPEIEPSPLAPKHLPAKSTAGSHVALVKLRRLTNVNRLSPANEIEFGAAPGLTVIYGDNGAGKSGYARVIRKACRARGAAHIIQPNALTNAPSRPASAEFVISVTGTEMTVPWTDGPSTDGPLGRILFFDGACAEHYVNEDGSTSFSPDGLDVLTKLTQACDTVKEQLAKRVRTTQELINTTKRNWSLHEGTKVAAFVGNLTAVSDEEKISTLAQWDPIAQKRLEEVRLLLASNPQQKAAITRASVDRIKAFREKLDAQYSGLNNSVFEKVRKLRDETAIAEAAYAVASQAEFGSNYLPGTGGELWRLLWDAARQYSTLEAYTDVAFPNTSKDAVCVLCQAPLGATTAQRLAAFEAYVQNETLRLLEQKKAELKSSVDALDAVRSLETEYSTIEGDLTDLRESDRNQVASCVLELWARRNSLLTFVKTGEKLEETPMPPSAAGILSNLETQKRSQADSEVSLHDPIARGALQRESNELEDRLWLQTNGNLMREQIARFKVLARLNAAQGDTNTTQVTAKATALSKAIVTEALCNAFGHEVKALGLRTISVGLHPAGGQKGTLRFGVRLAGVNNNIVGKVASEGEKRCIAFALFMAELSQTADASSLVLDDPVSSLDHLHCELLAKRIASESTKRQVIVFTHNPLFLHDLQAGAEESGANLSLGYLQWNGDTPGEWVPGHPWNWKTVKDRFNHLQQMQQRLAKTSSLQMTEDDKQGVRTGYSMLRSTLERIVETKIFGGAVMRFRNYINVKHVERAVGFTQGEFDELQRLFNLCSDVTEAHDISSGSHKTVPTPQSLKLDIEATEKLVDTITSRQNFFKKPNLP